MRYLLFLILVLYIPRVCSSAQSLSVESFRILENDLTANTFGTIKYDANGNVAALIKVVTTGNGFTFDVGSLGVVATSQQKGEIWLYVPGGVQRITISHTQWGELHDYYFPIPIEQARTYELKLQSGVVRTVGIGDDATLCGSLEIDSDPMNGNIWFDDVFIGQTPMIKESITAGKHKILVQKEGYCIWESNVDINEGKVNSMVVSLQRSKENGHEFVDLGLSVKWATCNVDADTPEGYGRCYAWGEIQTKGDFSWPRYKYCEGSYVTLTKYCDVGTYGNKDERTVLGLSDDAAAANWKGHWRMPTREEFKELIDSCTWTWTKQGYINGYLVKGKKPGYTECSIFLPAAGYRKERQFMEASYFGVYWSSSLTENRPIHASGLFFDADRKELINDSRSYGLYIRPVCP